MATIIAIPLLSPWVNGTYYDDTIFGTYHHDIIEGLSGDDLIHAGGGDDEVSGGHADDTLHGEDDIEGGDGNDDLFGGDGSDIFLFKNGEASLALVEGKVTSVDRIMEFQVGDRIDLSAIDANQALTGNQAFHFASALTGQAGELTVTMVSDGAQQDVFRVLGDFTGDGTADFRFDVTAQSGLNLAQTDYFLL